MDPAHIYAFEKLGYLVTDMNSDTFTDEELNAWDDAVQEWCDQHPDEEAP